MFPAFNNNPLYKRAKQMSAGKSEKELEMIANNLCNQMGVDINQAFEQFKQFKKMFGIK